MLAYSAQHNSRSEYHVRTVMFNIVLVRLKKKLLVDDVNVFKITRLLEELLKQQNVLILKGTVHYDSLFIKMLPVF